MLMKYSSYAIVGIKSTMAYLIDVQQIFNLPNQCRYQSTVQKSSAPGKWEEQTCMTSIMQFLKVMLPRTTYIFQSWQELTPVNIPVYCVQVSKRQKEKETLNAI